jgi:hypothetical protein
MFNPRRDHVNNGDTTWIDGCLVVVAGRLSS